MARILFQSEVIKAATNYKFHKKLTNQVVFKSYWEYCILMELKSLCTVALRTRYFLVDGTHKTANVWFITAKATSSIESPLYCLLEFNILYCMFFEDLDTEWHFFNSW